MNLSEQDWIYSSEGNLHQHQLFQESGSISEEDYSDFLVWLIGHFTQYEIRGLAPKPTMCHQQKKKSLFPAR